MRVQQVTCGRVRADASGLVRNRNVGGWTMQRVDGIRQCRVEVVCEGGVVGRADEGGGGRRRVREEVVDLYESRWVSGTTAGQWERSECLQVPLRRRCPSTLSSPLRRYDPLTAFGVRQVGCISLRPFAFFLGCTIIYTERAVLIYLNMWIITLLLILLGNWWRHWDRNLLAPPSPSLPSLITPPSSSHHRNQRQRRQSSEVTAATVDPLLPLSHSAPSPVHPLRPFVCLPSSSLPTPLRALHCRPTPSRHSSPPPSSAHRRPRLLLSLICCGEDSHHLYLCSL